MGYWYAVITKRNDTPELVLEPIGIDGITGYIAAFGALQWIQPLGSPPTNPIAQIGITSYYKDGQLFEGNWQEIHGDNITQVTFSLTVASANTQAIGVVLNV